MVLARSLAGISMGPLLLYNFTALEQNVARVAQEADVASAIVLDAEGKVAASSVNAGQVGTEADDPVGRQAAATSVLLLQEITTKPSGTGLGLAIVHTVVEDHGGTVGSGWGGAAAPRSPLSCPSSPRAPSPPCPTGRRTRGCRGRGSCRDRGRDRRSRAAA
jgi:hypothetical protein